MDLDYLYLAMARRFDFRLELNLGNDLGAKTNCLAQVNFSGPWENT
jgi:hypothetical protein